MSTGVVRCLHDDNGAVAERPGEDLEHETLIVVAGRLRAARHLLRGRRSVGGRFSVRCRDDGRGDDRKNSRRWDWQWEQRKPTGRAYQRESTVVTRSMDNW